jgi:hypothetical protein
VIITTNLSWAAASKTNTYKVYFGTSDPPAYQGEQVETTYDPSGNLDTWTDYYWRITTVNDWGEVEGDLWTFTTGGYIGDLDHDNDVDQEDFGQFQLCYSGGGIGHQTGCEEADLDPDGDVDIDDFNEFQECMGGVNVLPPLECLGSG